MSERDEEGRTENPLMFEKHKESFTKQTRALLEDLLAGKITPHDYEEKYAEYSRELESGVTESHSFLDSWTEATDKHSARLNQFVDQSARYLIVGNAGGLIAVVSTVKFIVERGKTDFILLCFASFSFGLLGALVTIFLSYLNVRSDLIRVNDSLKRIKKGKPWFTVLGSLTAYDQWTQAVIVLSAVFFALGLLFGFLSLNTLFEMIEAGKAVRS